MNRGALAAAMLLTGVVLAQEPAATSSSGQDAATTQAASASPDAKRLTFLGDQISADEAAIAVTNKELLRAGYKVSVAVDRANAAVAGNDLMNRNGGGPVPWQDFYGRSARSFIVHDFPWGNEPLRRPDQFNYIYRANDNAIASAKNQVLVLGGKIDELLARRKKLEYEQSELWATIAFESVGNRDIAVRALYRYELKTAPSDPAKPRSDDARLAAMRAAVVYLKTINLTLSRITDRLATNQTGAYVALRESARKSEDRLKEAVATFVETPGVDANEARQMGEVGEEGKEIQSLCKDLVESFQKASEADNALDEQRKQLYRGTLQDSLFTFSESVAKLDRLITKMGSDWNMTAQAGIKSKDETPTIADSTQKEPVDADAGGAVAAPAVDAKVYEKIEDMWDAVPPKNRPKSADPMAKNIELANKDFARAVVGKTAKLHVKIGKVERTPEGEFKGVLRANTDQPKAVTDVSLWIYFDNADDVTTHKLLELGLDSAIVVEGVINRCDLSHKPHEPAVLHIDLRQCKLVEQ